MRQGIPDSRPNAPADQSPPFRTLAAYEEIVGTIERVERSDRAVSVHLSCGVLRYPAGSQEAKLLERELADNIGECVSILQLPAADESLRIRREE